MKLELDNQGVCYPSPGDHTPMEALPTTLNPDHLAFHLKLVGELKAATEAETTARAAVFNAMMNVQAANNALQKWIDHLTGTYNLKPQDGIDAEGNLHYVDIGWAIEAQARARAEAERAVPQVEVVPVNSDLIMDGDDAVWEDTHPEEDYHDPEPVGPPPSLVVPAEVAPVEVVAAPQPPPVPSPKKPAGKKTPPRHMPTI